MGRVSLRRYTNLAAAIHILQTRAITLLDPSSWDDGNDRHFMAHYKQQRRLKTLLALCFAEDNETYHHWKVFASGCEGVCIEFDKEGLIATAKHFPGVIVGNVDYVQIKDARKAPPRLDQLPFTKRYPYHPENEFRIIYEHQSQLIPTRDISISLDLINRITLSPWMPKPLRASVVETLRSIAGCSKLKIYRTTLLENEQWKQLVDKVGAQKGA